MKKYIDINSIRFKITLFIVSSVFIIFNVFIFSVTTRNRQIAIEQSEKQILNEVERYVFEIKNLIENHLNETNSFARTLSSVKSPKNPIKLSREQVISLMTNILYENSQYSSLGVYWEPNAFDLRDEEYVRKLYHDLTGNFVPEIRRGANSSIIIEANPNGYLKDYYLSPKQTGKNYIDKLYMDSEGERLEAPFSSPINYRGIIYGVVRFNIDLTEVVNKTQELEILEKRSNLQLISSGARIIAESNRIETVNTDLQDLIDNPKEISEILALKSYVFYETEKEIIINYPISFQNTSNSWFVRVTTPKSAILENATKQQYFWLMTNIGIFLISLIIVGLFISYLIKPLQPIVKYVEQLAEGNVSKKSHIYLSGTEIKQIDNALDKLANNLNRNAEFAKQIGEGKFNESFTPVSKNDVLGSTLFEMQNSLIAQKKEETKRIKRERIRTWTNDGIAELNEVVRLAPEQVQGLTNAVLAFLIKYLKINQGAFFVYQTPENKPPYFEMSAAYAYNKSRKAEKIISANDGLIYSCIKEQKTIILKEIPSNYLEISSGVGAAKPNFLLLTPLIHGSSILGVIELASFNEMKSYEVELVEMAATAIAAEIASIKVKENTDTLLKESRTLALKMAEEEEELRYKLKKVSAKNENSEKQLKKNLKELETINKGVFIIEYNSHQIITDSNRNFLQFLAISKEELIGKSHQQLLQNLDSETSSLTSFWDNLKNGNEQSGIFSYKINKKRFSLSEHYFPILDQNDQLIKVIKVAIDITELKNKSEQFESKSKLLDANEKELEENIRILNLYKEKVYDSREQLSSLLQVIEPIICLGEFNSDGKIQSINSFFEETFNLPKSQIIGRNVVEVLSFEHNKFDEIWEFTKQNKTFDRISKMYTGNGELWLSEHFTPIKDSKGEIDKIWYVAYPITRIMQDKERFELRIDNLLKLSKNFRTNLHTRNNELKEVSKLNQEHISMSNALHNLLTITTYSPTGQILAVNQRVEQLTGLESDRLIGLSYNNLIKLPEAYDEELFWMDAQTEAIEIETKILLSEKEIWLSEVYYPIFEDTKLVKVISVGMNITSIKHSFEEQRNIAVKVRQISNELTKEQELGIQIKRKTDHYLFFKETYKEVISEIAGLLEFDADGHMLSSDKKSNEYYKLKDNQLKHHSDFVLFQSLNDYNKITTGIKAGKTQELDFKDTNGRIIKQKHIPIVRNNKTTRIILISSPTW